MTSMANNGKADRPEKCSFEEALDLTGFSKYNAFMLTSCCLLILSMYLDIFGYSVTLPAMACDLNLTVTQQGLLSAVPLIGVMFSSYAWGLCADTLGRRVTLLMAMPISVVLSIAGSLAPTYTSLAVLKFFSSGFFKSVSSASAANAAAFVLVGETTPQRHRSQFVFLMASATMFVQLVISLIALPVFQLTFDVSIPWMSLQYRPWRLLLQIIIIPGVLGLLGMFFLHESPKFLLNKGREGEAVEVLRKMNCFNNGRNSHFNVSSIFLEESTVPVQTDTTFLRKVWNQTAPLFKPPLLRNSIILYFLLLCAYMTATGFTMWVPTMTNAYFNGEETDGKTFCDVASTASSSSSNTTDCNNAIQPFALYAVASYSGLSGSLNTLLSFLVGPVGKKKITLIIFSVSAACGVALVFVRIPMLSILLFFILNYVALILGTVNTYLVELNPTHLRGMATCLSVVVARGFGFISVQIIALLLADYCTPMLSGYVVLVMIGLAVAFLLPADTKRNTCQEENNKNESTRF